MTMAPDDLFDVTRSNEPALRGDLFTAEEMDAIREQYEERSLKAERELEGANARAEELEFQVKRALAAVRDCEEQMRKMRLQLESMLVEDRPAPKLPAPPIKAAPVIGGPVLTTPAMGLPS